MAEYSLFFSLVQAKFHTQKNAEHNYSLSCVNATVGIVKSPHVFFSGGFLPGGDECVFFSFFYTADVPIIQKKV